MKKLTLTLASCALAMTLHADDIRTRQLKHQRLLVIQQIEATSQRVVELRSRILILSKEPKSPEVSDRIEALKREIEQTKLIRDALYEVQDDLEEEIHKRTGEERVLV